MVYQSFDNKKNRIEKNWNRVENNKNNLTNIPITSLDFNSINFNKEITTISLLDNELLSVLPLDKVQTILLENFPEWALNMIEPHVVYSIDDGYVSSIIDTSLAEANNNGTLKNGDISIATQNWEYWYNRIDQSNFLLKIFYNIRVFRARKSGSGSGFSSSNVPIFANISLKIYNHRIYETMDEKFE